MWVDRPDILTKFVFDLEFVGDITKDIRDCRIWEIGCICIENGWSIRIVVNPLVSRQKLTNVEPNVVKPNVDDIDNAGISLMEAVIQWSNWIHQCCISTGGRPAMLMSHNCFKSGLLVILSEFGRIHATFTTPVIFFDTLPFIRFALRGERRTSFSLEDLTTGSTLPNHSAIMDCRRLWQVLMRCNVPISGLAVQYGTVPLTAITGIGVTTARVLESRGIYGVRQLIENVSLAQKSTDAAACLKHLHSMNTSAVPMFASLDTISVSLADFCIRMGW